MSYDFDVMLKPCDHLQRLERMVISSDDWRTLLYAERPGERVRGTISALDKTQLFFNGVEVPKDHETYGWDVLFDELSIAPERKHKIVFHKQVRLTNILIQINYITIPAYCMKCNGYSKTNDYKRNTNGSFIHITDHDKLIQRVFKFLLTSRCNFYPIFVSQLKEFVGRKFGLSLTETDISYECVTALDNLKKIQIAQKNVQFLSPQEILRDTESVNSKRQIDDPTVVLTKLKVSSYGIPQPKSMNFTIRTTP
jgi:hypothetical protein